MSETCWHGVRITLQLLVSQYEAFVHVLLVMEVIDIVTWCIDDNTRGESHGLFLISNLFFSIFLILDSSTTSVTTFTTDLIEWTSIIPPLLPLNTPKPFTIFIVNICSQSLLSLKNFWAERFVKNFCRKLIEQVYCSFESIE